MHISTLPMNKNVYKIKEKGFIWCSFLEHRRMQLAEVDDGGGREDGIPHM